MKILLIEDNYDHSLLISDNCREAFGIDHELEHFELLESGLEALEKTHYDILLCDLKLPDSSIENTTERLKSLSLQTPIVVLTSLNDVEIARSLINQGIQDYLPKDELGPELLGRVCTYAIERKRQQVKLENKTEDQQAFCRSLTHDFKSPIRNIGQLSQMLRENINTHATLLENELDMFDLIDTKVAVINELVDGLYQYLKVDIEGAIVEPVDLASLINDVERFVQGRNDRHVELIVDPLPVIEGIRSQLFVLFQNLIGNGIKYNKNIPEIRISAVENKSENFCAISVSDNGIGIEKSDQKRIFEPFKRLHSSNQYNGSGLGLSIVKRIVENHSGKIVVVSKPRVGTTFSISLPLTQPART